MLCLAGVGAMYNALADAREKGLAAAGAAASPSSDSSAVNESSVPSARTVDGLSYIVAVLCILLVPNLVFSFIGSMIVLGP